MEVATWFLMLASKIIVTIFKSDNVWKMHSLSLQIYMALLSLFLWLERWKEKWLKRILINLKLGENSLLSKLKEGKTPLS